MAKSENLPEGFYRRGGIIWIRTDPITGTAKSTRSKTVDGALAYLGARERHNADPVHKAAAQATVGEWAIRICAIKAKTRSEGTADMYNSKTGHLVRIFGRHTSLVDITADKVDEYILRRQDEGVTNNTIQRELTCLFQLLRHARRAGVYHLEMSQVKPIGFSANYVPRATVLEPHELPILLKALTPERAAWVCMAIAVGGDISDVERILPGDYDPETQTIKLRGTKNRFRSATIPVPDQYLPLLEIALPWLPLNWPRVSHELKETCERVMITAVTPKDLRRTAATWLTDYGVSIDTLGKWMRHGGAKVTFDVYAASRPQATGNAMREQMQKRNSFAGPLGGMADAGDLKNHANLLDPKKTSEISQTEAHRDTAKLSPTNTDLLQRAEARVRKLRTMVAIDPELGPTLAIAELLVESYHQAGGDGDPEKVLALLTAGAVAIGGDQ